MRNMSFQMTTDQIMDGTKDVTRRLGWANAKVGELIQGVEKGQGLKKGEKVKKLRVIRIVSVRGEALSLITDAECIREGFPEMNPQEFVEMFCKHNKCEWSTVVNRIEFEYVDAGH